MDWKQSLDRYLTTEPDDGFTDFCEAVDDFISEQYPQPEEFWNWTISIQAYDIHLYWIAFDKGMNLVEATEHIFLEWDRYVGK